MASRRSSVVKRTSDWRRSWLVALAACSGFAVASLQPSVTVARGHEVELVSAKGPDFELPQDELAALSWLADAGIVVDDDRGEITAADSDEAAATSRFSDMAERALAEMNSRMQPGPTPTTTGPTTTTQRRATTTTERPATTTTERPATTTTERPATTTTQSATVQAEQRFVQLINQERAARDLAELDVDPEIRTVARNWTATMIREADGCSGGLQHNDGLRADLPKGWGSYGENVGCGQSVDSLHRLLMASSGHRANILGELFTDVGVGVDITADGTMWVTQIFAQY